MQNYNTTTTSKRCTSVSAYDLKKKVQEAINTLEMDRLNPILHVDMAQKFKQIEDKWLFLGSSIGGNELAYIFSLPDLIISQFQNLAYYSKKIVSDTIEGKRPLMYWNNSISACSSGTK